MAQLNFLFIDVDTVRAKGMEHESSTKAEKSACKDVAKGVLAHLDSLRWPQPILGDSGNGFHILPRVRLENSDHNVNLLGDCLKALSAKFSCAAAKIDCAVFNAARLTRAYGTTTRKGTDTPERPYRHNRLLPLDGVAGAATLDQVLALGSEVPYNLKRRDDGMPVPLDSFSPEDYFEWFEEQGAFEVEGDRDWRGHTIRVTNICILAGHKHSGSAATGFVIGDTFGYKCFSDDCEGATLAAVHKKLEEQGYKLYPFPIFRDEGLEAIEEYIEKGWVEDLSEREREYEAALDIDTPEPEPEKPGEPGAAPETKRERLKIGKVKELATWMLGTLLRDPVGMLPKFLQKRSYIEKVVLAHLEVPVNEVLICVMGYHDDTGSLPTKSELKNYIFDSNGRTARAARASKYMDRIISFIDEVDKAPGKEFMVMVTELERAVDWEMESRAVHAAYKRLKQDFDIDGCRNELRAHWQSSAKQAGDILAGPMQEMTEEISAEFYKDVSGANDSGKFVLGFPSIDSTSNIGLEGERTIFFYGPASNRKTTALMTVALNGALRGRNGLLLVGEHQGMPTYKTLLLMLAHYFKDDPDIGALPDRAGWEGLNRTATVADWERLNVLLGKVRTREALPGILEAQNIESVCGGEEDRLGACLDYVRALNQKHPLDFLLIDPLDSVMPLSALGRDNAWQEGKDWPSSASRTRADTSTGARGGGSSS